MEVGRVAGRDHGRREGIVGLASWPCLREQARVGGREENSSPRSEKTRGVRRTSCSWCPHAVRGDPAPGAFLSVHHALFSRASRNCFCRCGYRAISRVPASVGAPMHKTAGWSHEPPMTWPLPPLPVHFARRPLRPTHACSSAAGRRPGKQQGPPVGVRASPDPRAHGRTATPQAVTPPSRPLGWRRGESSGQVRTL